MTIPISKLNCTYCKKFDGKCSLGIIDLSKDRLPEKEYCVQIFRDDNWDGEQGKEKYSPKEAQPPQQIAAGMCPDCGSTLWFQEGCATCQSCGFSKC